MTERLAVKLFLQFLLCFAAWLGFSSSLRAEYASVIAPPADDTPIHVLRLDRPAGDNDHASLRFLSSMYLEQYDRGSMGEPSPKLVPVPPPNQLNDAGANPPPLLDQPSSAPVAALTGEFLLVADPWVSHFLLNRERLVVHDLGDRLFRPPRQSFPGA